MSREALSPKKRITVADLRPGMYIVGLDRSWIHTPFLFHRRLIQQVEEIDQLKKHGIAEVVIDTSRGADVGTDAGDAVGEKNNRAGDRAAVSTDSLQAGAAEAAPAPRSDAEKAFQPLARELAHARTVHEEALLLAQSIFDGAGGGAPIDAHVVAQVIGNLQASIERSPEASLLLMQMRRFQKDIFTHAVNVCVLSIVVASLEGLDAAPDGLAMGALLHDLGETRLPRQLLRKISDFTEAETMLLKQHPTLGVALLAHSDGIPTAVLRMVADHHERIDGSGYPAGKVGSDLSADSQLLALVDCYDDMLSGRNQAALQPTEVLRQLYMQANSGAANRDLVETVIRSLGVYPIGSVVELNTGERGVVVATNRSSALKPTVRIIMSRSGLVQFNGPIVSLGDAGADAVERRIVAVIDPVKERIDPLVFLRLTT